MSKKTSILPAIGIIAHPEHISTTIGADEESSSSSSPSLSKSSNIDIHQMTVS
jgi:hypothetical protein